MHNTAQIMKGDKVRVRGCPGLGTGVVVERLREAAPGIPYKFDAFRVRLTGLDEGEEYTYEETYPGSELFLIQR